ncbi:MAG: BMP family ABC transporter substrate-binding protein [bacterium]|nr:BMP family ABC transporter substrate-binding protein [bacterium]
MTGGLIGESNYYAGGVDGIQQAAELFGVETQVIESLPDPASISETLRGVVLDEWDMVIVMSFVFNDVLAEVAPQHPDTQFICIDCFVDAANVQGVDFRTQEASYLTGIIAGRLTETDVIGSVLAFDIPFLHRWVDPFHEAVLSVNPDATILEPLEVGDWADPVTAKELAITVAGQNADIVNGLAASGNGGVFEAAAELGFYSFGVDINECGVAPGHVIENVIKRINVVVVGAVETLVEGGEFEPFVTYGLAENGVGLSQFIEDGDTGCVFADHPELFDEVMAAQEAIIAGEIVIPDPAAG